MSPLYHDLRRWLPFPANQPTLLLTALSSPPQSFTVGEVSFLESIVYHLISSSTTLASIHPPVSRPLYYDPVDTPSSTYSSAQLSLRSRPSPLHLYIGRSSGLHPHLTQASIRLLRHCSASQSHSQLPPFQSLRHLKSRAKQLPSDSAHSREGITIT